MDTMTTIEAVERTPSGAFKITFQGDAVAGTRDEEVGALAEKLVGTDDNLVQVSLERLPDGKLLVKTMQEVPAPEVLGGPAEQPAPVGGPGALLKGGGEGGEAKSAPTPVPDMTLDEALKIGNSLPTEVLLLVLGERAGGVALIPQEQA